MLKTGASHVDCFFATDGPVWPDRQEILRCSDSRISRLCGDCSRGCDLRSRRPLGRQFRRRRVDVGLSVRSGATARAHGPRALRLAQWLAGCPATNQRLLPQPQAAISGNSRRNRPRGAFCLGSAPTYGWAPKTAPTPACGARRRGARAGEDRYGVGRARRLRANRHLRIWCGHQTRSQNGYRSSTAQTVELSGIFGALGEIRTPDPQTPSLKPAMHRFVIRITLRQHVPLRPGVQNPQRRFKDFPRRNRFPTRASLRNVLFRKMVPDTLPIRNRSAESLNTYSSSATTRNFEIGSSTYQQQPQSRWRFARQMRQLRCSTRKTRRTASDCCGPRTSSKNLAIQKTGRQGVPGSPECSGIFEDRWPIAKWVSASLELLQAARRHETRARTNALFLRYSFGVLGPTLGFN